MNLPRLSMSWSLPELVKNLIEAFRQLEASDKQNRKSNGDVEIASGQRLIMLGDDGVKYVVSIVGGSLTVSAL